MRKTKGRGLRHRLPMSEVIIHTSASHVVVATSAGLPVAAGSEYELQGSPSEYIEGSVDIRKMADFVNGALQIRGARLMLST